MEVGTEISQKIRSAIKAKLLELGSYVDDELPDYIMVMVANKKTRSQMNSDLGLFLGANTSAFTEWLHGLLEKLQTISFESDKSLTKQGKGEKSKSSKEKKKDKEKLPKGDTAVKKSSKEKESKDKKQSNENVSDTITDIKKITSEMTPGSNSSDDNKKHKDKDTLLNLIEIPKHPTERDKSISDDVEDVRQLLVTQAGEDELAEELETTEVAISKIVKDATKKTSVSIMNQSDSVRQSRNKKSQSPEHHRNINQSRSKPSQSPESHRRQESAVSRKRKAPISVVAAVRQEDADEEEYDPHNPAVGTVASVVKVTTRKSSVPPLLQANRLLLLKAMTEAERSVAAKKKVIVAKPISRDNSPAEVYSPKRKRSDLSCDQESPPPYIPSKKGTVGHRSDGGSSSQRSETRVLTHDDARHMLNKDGNRESRRETILRTVGVDRGSSHRQEPARSPERGRSLREDDKNIREVKSEKHVREVRSDKGEKIIREVKSDKGEKIIREVKSDKGEKIIREVRSDNGEKNVREVRSDNSLKGDNDLKSSKNFQITCHVSSGSRLTDSHHVDSRKRQHSPSPEPKQTLQVTISSATSQNSKSAAARLGKIIVERNSSHEDNRDTVNSRTTPSVSSSGHRDAREDIIAKMGKSKGSLNQKTISARSISNLGKEAAQKQCAAAVISVQAAEMSNRAKRNKSPDSRVVECDTQSMEEETPEKDTGRNKEEKGSSLKSSISVDSLDIKDKSPGDTGGDDDDDLSKMIDEDLGPELLDDTNGDEFTLDLDIDEDLSHVVGISEDESVKPDIQEAKKDEKKSGTRFIVTLDGVDDRQFRAEDNSNIFRKFKQPPVGSVPAVVTPLAVSNSEQPHPHQSYSFPMEHRVAAELLQQNRNLYLNLLGTQVRPISQASLPQLQTPAVIVPSKLTPPKIQPFSISLKDSDDEHEDKEGKVQGKSPVAVQDYFEQVEGDASALKRAKMSERCKFWPACAAGVSCEFHHPTTHCKTFPNCKFGDKCLFIHPNCRFDSKCARPDCPYTHTSRRPALASATHVITLPQPHFVFSSIPPKSKYVSYPSIQTVCHYFPNCQNINCRFLHPKPCKFGTVCKSPACPFYHPPVPGKDKLKWQASSGQIKSEVMSTPISSKVEMVEKHSLTLPSHVAAVSSTSQ